ncbi:MAG: cupin domain-containing protein [Verrucomicrobia bacterium]|jgi:glucose-6-phosphate isomerase|nr:cupin domain-containing protein [Verrucomicrobiota bacterium]
MLEFFKTLGHAYAADSAAMDGGAIVERRLSDLRGFFADAEAFETALAREDSLLYRVTAIEPADGDGDLHYGLGILFPGKVGDEYYLTKGHLHSTREAAEVYLGLRGEGCLLLEDEQTGESRLEPLGTGRIVYVPGHTAHRTMNTGTEPLTYIGVYPANAGHDYGAIAERNFRKVLVEENGRPVLKDREAGS